MALEQPGTWQRCRTLEESHRLLRVRPWRSWSARSTPCEAQAWDLALFQDTRFVSGQCRHLYVHRFSTSVVMEEEEALGDGDDGWTNCCCCCSC